MKSSKVTKLIPRKVLFDNPDKTAPRLNPKGDKIGFLAPINGVLNVWVGPADNPKAAKPVTHDTDRGIRSYTWAYTNQHILYIQDKGGDENWRVYCVDLKTKKTRDLTPVEGVQARIQEVSYKNPSEIIIGLNDRNAQLHDLYQINIETGEKILLQENPGFMGFVTDDEYQVRFGMRMTTDGGVEMLKKTDTGEWETFMNVPMEDTITTSPVGFDKSNRILYLTDSRQRDTSALVALDTRNNRLKILAEDPRADVHDFIIHPTNKNIQTVAFNYDRIYWKVLDPDIEKDFHYLSTVTDGDFQIASRTMDDLYWIVVYVIDDGAFKYYHYDRKARQANFLFTNRRNLAGYPLVKMQPVVIPSRDSLKLVSYYSLPWGCDRARPGYPDKPLPMILFVHGGPWGRDEWGFNPFHQLLANRGYAVLSVNFRGSTGLGKAFINAGNKEWGRKMHNDLLDAVAWAVKVGIADPDRVAIIGGSYGGYATLVGLTFTPTVFACGVDIVGPSNLVTLLESIPPYWKPELELFASRVGDPRTKKGKKLLQERSPLNYVDRIQKPLLIGQGANDPRVKKSESDQIVQAMQAKNIPVTYLLYPDEGHGFARPENWLSFNAVTEVFLARHLGGRYELIGNSFEGSSIQVVLGKEDVPGVSEILADKSI